VRLRDLACLVGLGCTCACRQATRPAFVVAVPVASGDGVVLQTIPSPAPEPPRERPFELIAGYRLCARIGDAVHCRDSVDPDRPLAAEPSLLGDLAVTSVGFGRDFGCVTTPAGAVECFGGNQFGQLGARLRDEKHDQPIALPGLRDARHVAVGPFHACAILGDGKVACWGKNQAGENGSDTSYLSAARELVEPHVVAGVEGVTELALGWDATCAVSQDRQVRCWGRAKLDEQRATGGETNETPAAVASLAGASSITANESAFCAVKDQKVVCWGDVMMLDAKGPGRSVSVVGVEGARRVSLGSNHGCAIDAAGSVYCFGSNMSGELGIPRVEGDYVAHAPEKVPGVPRAVEVVCGASLSCAVTAEDETWCWGGFGWTSSVQEVRTPVVVRVMK
jgi:alpha-tubulin suppressor-like RCC1 family protein